MTANPLPFRKDFDASAPPDSSTFSAFPEDDVAEEMHSKQERTSNSASRRWHMAAVFAILLVLAAIAYPLYYASDAVSDWWSEAWNTRPDTTTASQQKIPDPFALLSSRLDSLEQQHAADGATQNAVRGEVDGMQDQLEQFVTRDELNELREGFNQFRRSQSANARRLAALERTRAAVTAATEVPPNKPEHISKPPQLPFRVLSIDLWDGKPYAAVAPMDSGDIELLSVGERRVGWEVRFLDYSSGQALFADESGRTVQRTAEDFRP